MKILFLAPFPCSPLRANTVRPCSWLSHLSGRHEVTLVHFSDPGAAPFPSGPYRAVSVERRPKSGPLARAANLFSRRPYFLCDQFRSEAMSRALGSLEGGPFDVVHCSSVAMAQYVPPAAGRVKVLDGVDCNARNNLQQARSAARLGERLLSWTDWRKLRTYEPAQYRRFDAGLLASPEDREFLLKLDPSLRVRVLPNGVDLEYFKPAEALPGPGGSEIVFAGPMSYPPNRDAVAFFCSDVLPRVLEKRPDAVFRVLGSALNAPPVSGPSAGSVVFSGHVPDVRPFVSAAGAVVCPLRQGTGIKNKVLEAMAMGKALVMTPVAAEGVRAEAGRDYLSASGPAEMAAALLRVLADRELALRLGASARKAAEAGHDWTSLASGLESIYEELLAL